MGDRTIYCIVYIHTLHTVPVNYTLCVGVTLVDGRGACVLHYFGFCVHSEKGGFSFTETAYMALR